MIITQQKDINEIYAMIKDYNKILIAGCDGCCQPPRSINEATVLGQLLELKAQTEGKKLIWKAITILRQCDDRIAATTVRPFVEDYDAMDKSKQNYQIVLGLTAALWIYNILDAYLFFPKPEPIRLGLSFKSEGHYLSLVYKF